MLDLLGVGFALLLGLTREERVSGMKNEDRLTGAIFSVVYGVSALSGFERVKLCKSAQREAARRTAGEDANAATSASPTLAPDPASWPAPLAPPLRRPNGATRTGR